MFEITGRVSKKELVLALFDFGFSYTLIAQKVGVSRQAVQRRLSRLNLVGGDLPKRKPEIVMAKSAQSKRQCSYPECSNKHKSNGYCTGHISQLYRGKALCPLRRPKKDCDFP